jgi:hypothetical protein
MNTPVQEHPTVKAHRRSPALQKTSEPLDAGWLRQVCLDAGADAVGFVEVDRPALAEERPHIQRVFPHTRSLISFVLRMNRDNVRNPARSVANLEFHHTGDDVNDVARRITAALDRAGIRAMNPPMGFPMEADRWGYERMWVVAHKPIAVAAGLGHMGIHRNVIHPRFGNFILLGTVLVGADISAHSQELDYNPCLASCAWPRVRSEQSAATARSTSPLATRIITENSWADLRIGSRTSRKVAMGKITGSA